MNIVVIIQARMDSTRLKGKVLFDLEGKTVLAHVIERCKAMTSANDVIVAIPDKQNDDPIQKEVEKAGIFCYRGSETNLLLRFYEAAKLRAADVVVRVTSDCPLVDPELGDLMISKFLESDGTDFCSNSMIRNFPRGLDVEVFSFAALEYAFLNATLNFEMEHVTPYIYQHPEIFKLTPFTAHEDNSKYRWTLDTPEDWLLIKEIYRRLYVPGQIFPWRTALQLIKDYPQLQSVNNMIEQKKLSDP